VAIYAPALPEWTVGQPYSQQLTTVGGTAPFTWSDKNGDLAGSGLTLSSAGLVSGTPADAEEIQFTAEVADAILATDERILSMQVNDLPVITTESVDIGRSDQSYSQQLLSSGGTPPLVWSDRDSDLDGTGLSLSPDGLLNGTPSTTGTISFTARLEDASGSIYDRAFDLEIILNCCIGLRGNVDCDLEGVVDIVDIQVLIDNLFLTLQPLCCQDEADLDLSGEIDITDLQLLIDNQFISLAPLPECP
jgi:hypothetical protein